jgi:hypothetical protein
MEHLSSGDEKNRPHTEAGGDGLSVIRWGGSSKQKAQKTRLMAQKQGYETFMST